MTWANWIPTFATMGVFTVLGWLLRVPLRKGIEGAISNVFDKRLETFKSELRRDEEQLRAELQLWGAEIDALRSSAFVNFSSRQAELGKRRLLAIERVWAEIVELYKYKHFSYFVQYLNIDSILGISDNPIDKKKMSDFATLILGDLSEPKSQMVESLANKERPFVSEIAFARFLSYRTIVLWPYLLLQSLRLQGDMKLLKTESVVETASKALPHQKAFLDEHGIGGVPFLVDELETAVLSSLREALEQKDADEAAVARAQAINQAVSATFKQPLPVAPPSLSTS